MFCVLTVKQRRDSVKERLFGNFTKDAYSLVTVPVIGGAPFYHLSATVGKKGIDPERVIFEVGRCAERLLVEENVKLPKYKGIGEYDSDLLYRKMMNNTAKFIFGEIEDGAEYIEEKGVITYKGNTLEIGRDRNDFDFSGQYSSLKPQGIEKYKFAAALYELCGVFAFGECRFNSVILNGEKKSI